MILYDNAFSPFARKVRMVLEHKQLRFTAVDGLHEDHRQALAAVNPRREVPVLVDGEVVVCGSSHIVAYLEEAYPQHPVMPSSPALRAQARQWEHLADSFVDAVVVDASLWTWAQRPDRPPPGLMELAQRDLDGVWTRMEETLERYRRDFLCGTLSVADIALFPHVYSARALGLMGPSPRWPALEAWLERMSANPVMQDDVRRARAWVKSSRQGGYELDKIFWRGDRVEWLLANGFHEWFMREIAADRVAWPAAPL